MDYDRVTFETLMSGEHPVAVRADVDLKRTVLIVHRRYDRLAMCVVEMDETGEQLRRLLGVTHVTPTGLRNLRLALESLEVQK